MSFVTSGPLVKRPTPQPYVKLKSERSLALLTMRGIKICRYLKIPKNAPLFSRKSRKALKNLKTANFIKCNFHDKASKDYLTKFDIFSRLLKSKPKICSDSLFYNVKNILHMSFIGIWKSQWSYRKLKSVGKTNILCLCIQPSNLKELNMLRFKCDDLYLQLKVATEADLITFVSDLSSFEKGPKISVHYNVDFEDNIYSLSNNLLRTTSTDTSDSSQSSAFDSLKLLIPQPTFQTRVVSLNICNSFLEVFHQCCTLNEFASSFPCLHSLTLFLSVDEYNSHHIEGLKLPHSLKQLSSKFQVSIISYGETFYALKSVLSNICTLSNLEELTFQWEVNIYLFSFYQLFVDAIPNCINLRSIIFQITKHKSFLTVFNQEDDFEGENDTFPLSNLFENASKLALLEKMSINLPLINEYDLIKLGRIDLNRLKFFGIWIQNQKGLKNEDLRSLIRFVSKNTQLETLEMNVTSDEVNDVGIKNFCYQFSRLRKLRKLVLNLVSANITQNSIIEIAKTVHTLQTLRKVKLSFRSSTEFYLNTGLFLKLISASKSLEYFRITSPYFSFQNGLAPFDF